MLSGDKKEYADDISTSRFFISPCSLFNILNTEVLDYVGLNYLVLSFAWNVLNEMIAKKLKLMDVMSFIQMYSICN